MRIIAGKLGGQTFESPKSHMTHPMSERVRGALFNSLGDISGLSVLDAFAGSGALCYEAISRGADSAVAIDIDKKAIDVIKKNTASINLNSRIKAIRANVSSWSDNNPTQLFDIVFAAPPYNNLQEPLVAKLTRHVNKDGIFVLDWPGKRTLPYFDKFVVSAQNNYGDAQLVFYHPNA